MTEETPIDGLALVSADEFEGCELEAPVQALNCIDMISINQAYSRAAHNEKEPCSKVYALVAGLCSIHLDPAGRGGVWSPGMAFDGKRTLIPSDIRGAQSDILENQVGTIKHHALRARIADIVWSNNLKKGAVASIALNAYCDCVDGLFSKALVPSHEMDGLYIIEAQRIIQRILQIASATSKKGALPERVKTTAVSIYQEAMRKNKHVPFVRMAQLVVDYNIIDKRQVATESEEISAQGNGVYAEAVRMVLDYATVLYRRLGDISAQERCQLKAVYQLLRMRDECGQAGAKASWVMDALLRLRGMKSPEAQLLEDELELELRSLQRKSFREMGSFSISLDVPEEREFIIKHFQDTGLIESLRDYSLLAASQDVNELKEQAKREGQQSLFSSMFAARHLDQEGKTIIETPSRGTGGEPSEEWYTHQIAQSENIKRAIIVANKIEPARFIISTKVVLEERHFIYITNQSPLVPESQAPIYALGFSRFFQGDFIAAAHLLIPQLEPSLRHLLKTYGGDPTKRRDDATEEDQSLDSIIINNGSMLDKIFGGNIVAELNRLFNTQPGPNLRHEMAHGQVSAGECYSENVIYGCWFLYRLICLPLVPHWEALVAPGLMDEGFSGMDHAPDIQDGESHQV